MKSANPSLRRLATSFAFTSRTIRCGSEQQLAGGIYIGWMELEIQFSRQRMKWFVKRGKGMMGGMDLIIVHFGDLDSFARGRGNFEIETDGSCFWRG